jgi:hypothetical protein
MKQNLKFSLNLFAIIFICFGFFQYKRLVHFREITSYLNSNDKNDLIDKEELERIKQFYNQLKQNDKGHFSQNGEDGILVKLAEIVNKTTRGEYVEFGAGNGDQTNTRLLRETYQWYGLLMDGYERLKNNPRINLHIEIITHQNVISLFEKVRKKSFILFIFFFII